MRVDDDLVKLGRTAQKVVDAGPLERAPPAAARPVRVHEEVVQVQDERAHVGRVGGEVGEQAVGGGVGVRGDGSGGGPAVWIKWTLSGRMPCLNNTARLQAG